MPKPKDPFPVTLADIAAQKQEAHKGLKKNPAPQRKGKPIIEKSKMSQPYLIQHT